MDGGEEQQSNSHPQHTPAFQRYHKILKMMQIKDNYQLIADMFADQGKFKESDQAKYQTSEKKKEFFASERKKILFTCVFQLNTQYTQFDQFTMAFYNWLNLPTTKFPIQRKEVEAYVRQRKNPDADKQKQKQKQKDIERQKQRLRQIQRQKQILKEKQSQDQMQRQRQRVQELARRQKQKQKQKERIKAELQRKKQQQQSQQRKSQQQYSGQKMVDESSASKNQTYRQIQQRSPVQPRPIQPMTPTSYPRTAQQQPGNPSPISHHPVTQQQPQSQQINPTSRVIARSPNPQSTSNQRYQTQGGGMNRNRNDAYHFSKPQISRQDQIKKILNKISQCYEYPEKRYKTQADIKLDLDYLRRLQDVERGNNSERGGRTDRK